MLYKRRLKALRAEMERKGIEAALLQHWADIYYFSGVNQRSTLMIPLEKEPVLLVQVGMYEAIKRSWIREIRGLEGIQSLKTLFSELGLERARIGINEDVISAKLHKRLVDALPDLSFIDISPLILGLRQIKSEEEISIIRKAAEVSRKGHKRAEEILREGLTELELAAEIETTLRKAGHSGFLCLRGRNLSGGYGIIGPSGPNLGVISGMGDITITGRGLGPAFPFGASKRKIKQGEMVIIDIGTNFQGYHSDEARMYVIGKADKKKRKAFEIILDAQETALDVVKPGIKGKEVYKAAKKVVDKAGYGEYFAALKDYPHYTYVGHGVGLEINEPPLLTPEDETILRENMTLAIEPKLIAPHWGVSLEDTILITSKGWEFLTTTKRKLIEA